MTLSALKTSAGTSGPRLKPIDNPKSLKLKLAYWFTKRRMGKVITPMKVHFARFPKGLALAQEIVKTEEKITIAPRLKHLIKVYTATLNGCAFCVDIGKAKASAEKQELDSHVFDNLLQFEESTQFNASEKAALNYVDEATRSKHVEDSTFARLRDHFSEREIVEITLLNAIENFYNLMNAPMNIGSDELCKIWSST